MADILHVARSPLAITFSVWRALFLREALTRIVERRAAWFWLLAEPVMHISYMVVFYTVIRVRTIGGIDTAVWIVVGLLTYFMFQRTSSQVANAIDANQALFAYRQVKPMDTLLVRAAMEAFLMVISSTVLVGFAALLGYPVIPDDPLIVMLAFFGVWLFGLGFGMLTSMAIELLPEFGKVLKFVTRPLYFISGVLHPMAAIPQPWRDWLMWNPLVHGLEAARLGFSSNYHAVDGVSISYVYECALVAVFLGLALHRRFAARLVMR